MLWSPKLLKAYLNTDRCPQVTGLRADCEEKVGVAPVLKWGKHPSPHIEAKRRVDLNMGRPGVSHAHPGASTEIQGHNLFAVADV